MSVMTPAWAHAQASVSLCKLLAACLYNLHYRSLSENKLQQALQLSFSDESL